MPSKSSPSKRKPNTKNEKADPRRRQLRWTQIVVGIFAVMIIMTMVLSMVAQQNLTK
jgi:hypothetical protein